MGLFLVDLLVQGFEQQLLVQLLNVKQEQNQVQRDEYLWIPSEQLQTQPQASSASYSSALPQPLPFQEKFLFFWKIPELPSHYQHPSDLQLLELLVLEIFYLADSQLLLADSQLLEHPHLHL